MKGTIWNNGKYYETGAGYGIKIDERDRDKYIKKEWTYLQILLEGEENFIEVNINKRSFWGGCSEIINKEIGKWLIKNNKGRWGKNNPPKVKLILLEENKFRIEFI
ncbi:hypothetical protein [Terrisporobacter hibernicus]|uniref:DUF5348 domain-containing protein n=1 Tax=Terrisporobacter hibernicus TaxID=2813371 RepID=A0AAX2ZAU1_9FIRM|nr:hypothetical protein [Terrisporobacter hibernicus]UEL46438.1 hypothetical protein JW646_12370 [Terrisporobacter hibernicus]